jgi:hypothetical protein
MVVKRVGEKMRRQVGEGTEAVHVKECEWLDELGRKWG